MNYDYKNHFGGVILIEKNSNNTVFLQTGDDANNFLNEIESCKNELSHDLVISQYF
jgi:hypothetical protein